MRFLRDNLIDAWYLLLVPGIAALLPWKLAWRWLRWWARREGGLFDEPARAAYAVASKYVPVACEKTFTERVRLIWLIDYCDFVLSLLRRRRTWYPWYVERVGAWPREGGFVAAGFHHGACNWLHSILAEAGHDCLTISIRWSRADFPGRPVRYWVGRMRYWDMQRIDRLPIAYRPGIKQKILNAFGDGAAVLSLVDTPPRVAPNGQRPVRLLGQDISFTEGVVALARESGVPVVPFWVEFDADLYKRRFCIGEPLDPNDVDAALRTLAEILDRQVRAAPEAWMFWRELPTWIDDARHLGVAADAARGGVAGQS